MSDNKACCVQDCERVVLSKRLCGMHYQRWKNGSLIHPNPPEPKSTECSIGDCGKTPISRGMCFGHYGRWKLGKPLDSPLRVYGVEAECSVAGCTSRALAKGMCQVHWGRQNRGAKVDAPVLTRLHTDDLRERLRRYAPEGNQDECWEWSRATNKGYGYMAVGRGRMRAAHIIAWEIANDRKMPVGMLVRHDCDNPLCTNPGHLTLGTHADNSDDKVSRGRQAQGSRMGSAKLTELDIPVIREMYKQGIYQRAIAAQFGVSQSLISAIILRKIWDHVA